MPLSISQIPEQQPPLPWLSVPVLVVPKEISNLT
jgi:hypothetical protein